MLDNVTYLITDDDGVTYHARRVKGTLTPVFLLGDIVSQPGPPLIIPAAPIVPLKTPTNSVAAPPNHRGVWPGTYADYTATPEFHRIAAAAKREWGYQCLLDSKHRGPVEMHHRSYAHVPFGEDWRDLIPLCEDCHKRFHHRLPIAPIGLFDAVELKRAA